MTLQSYYGGIGNIGPPVVVGLTETFYFEMKPEKLTTLSWIFGAELTFRNLLRPDKPDLCHPRSRVVTHRTIPCQLLGPSWQRYGLERGCYTVGL